MRRESALWINETLDNLDFWNHDYNLRVRLCHKNRTRRSVYCDEDTVETTLVADSQTLTFRTKDVKADTSTVRNRGNDADIVVYSLSIAVVTLVIFVIALLIAVAMLYVKNRGQCHCQPDSIFANVIILDCINVIDGWIS